GGFITFNSPLSSGDEVVIVSGIPFNRTTDYQNNGDFRPEVVNADFDRVVSLVKQVEDDASENLELINELDSNNLKRSGGQNTMAQPIIMGGQRIHSVGAPVAPDDAVRLQDVPTLNGDNIVVSTKEEDQLLVDGQTTVVFNKLTTIGGAIYVSGDDVDRGRLYNPVDFSIVDINTIELTNSYPASTVITLVQNEGAAETGNNRRVRDFSNLADAVANVGLKAGDSCNLQERTTGNGGGAMWDAVLASSVTINTFNIVQCTGVPTLALVLRVSDVVNVQQFGAIGNGLVNDTGSIQAALDYTITGVSNVVFPTATYVVDGTPLKFYGDSIIDGKGSTLKLQDGSYTTMTNFFANAEPEGGSYNPAYPILENITIKNFIIDGNITNVTTTRSCTALSAYKVFNFNCENVRIKDMAGETGEGYGIVTWYSEKVWLTDCLVDRTDRNNITIWETIDAHVKGCTAKDSFFRNCLLVSSNTPSSHQASVAIVEDCTFNQSLSSGSHAVRFSGECYASILNSFITATNTHNGIYIVDIPNKDITIMGNTISGGILGIEVESAIPARRVNISNNILKGNIGGIRWNADSGVAIIKGNIISSITTQPIYCITSTNVIIDSNVIDGGDQLFLQPKTGGIYTLTNNQIFNLTHASYAVLLSGSSTTNAMVVGNVLQDNVSNSMRLLSSKGTVIGNIANVIDSAEISVDFGNQRAMKYLSVMPSSGTWAVGDKVYKTNPTVLGAASSQYIVEGWRRITNGSGNVLNADWVEIRTLTGT
ncbi:MAG: hypothetical protein P8J14_01470, partial [Emcibacteraceae bacterium]|nr:hypothetical protein [Emcibacteraceae bacterium]